jgi:hypothetical protein
MVLSERREGGNNNPVLMATPFIALLQPCPTGVMPLMRR